MDYERQNVRQSYLLHLHIGEYRHHYRLRMYPLQNLLLQTHHPHHLRRFPNSNKQFRFILQTLNELYVIVVSMK